MQALYTRPHCGAAGSQEQDMTSVLFQPFHLHDLTLPNRIVLAPLTRSRAGTARLPNRLMAEYYSQRSSAGPAPHAAATNCRGGKRLEVRAGGPNPERNRR